MVEGRGQSRKTKRVKKGVKKEVWNLRRVCRTKKSRLECPNLIWTFKFDIEWKFYTSNRRFNGNV